MIYEMFNLFNKVNVWIMVFIFFKCSVFTRTFPLLDTIVKGVNKCAVNKCFILLREAERLTLEILAVVMTRHMISHKLLITCPHEIYGANGAL